MNSTTETTDERRGIELSVVGAALLNESACEYAMAEAQPAWFVYSDLRVMFAASCEMLKAGIPVDAMTLAEQLAKSGRLDDAGGSAGIAEAIDAVPHAAHVRHYLSALKTAHQRDRLRLVHERLGRQASDPTLEPSELIDDILSQLEGIRAGSLTSSELKSAADAIDEADAQEADPAKILPTGISELDRRLDGGLRAGQLVVVGGRPGLGKSALMSQLVFHAGQAGKPGIVCSFEMTAGEIAGRALRTISRDRFRGMPVWFSAASNFRKLESLIRIASRRHGIAVAAVDYLQLMDGSEGRSDNRERQIATMSRGLKLLAMELQIPILLGSQLNRESEKRGRPSLADLRESGAIEQDADVVILIGGDPESDARELIVAKHRGGSVGMVRAKFDGPRFQFSDQPWTGNL